MQTVEILEIIKDTLEYLQGWKDSIFEEIQQVKQQLDIVAGEIQEQEAYLELESSREQMESNIFNLYNTSEKHVKEKENLNSILEQKRAEQKRLEEVLDGLLKEMETINDKVVSNQVLVKHFTEIMDNQKEEETLAENRKLDITNQLELCLGILELDKERCAMELRRLIELVQS